MIQERLSDRASSLVVVQVMRLDDQTAPMVSNSAASRSKTPAFLCSNADSNSATSGTCFNNKVTSSCAAAAVARAQVS